MVIERGIYLHPVVLVHVIVGLRILDKQFWAGFLINKMGIHSLALVLCQGPDCQ
jgi:hypothetical protein